MISGLDHVALAVRDLDQAQAAYARLLGRAPNWVGGDGGARHAWFQLPNMAMDDERARQVLGAPPDADLTEWAMQQLGSYSWNEKTASTGGGSVIYKVD